MNRDALLKHLAALDLRLSLSRSFVKHSQQSLRAKRIGPEACVYVEMVLDELETIRIQSDGLSRALTCSVSESCQAVGSPAALLSVGRRRPRGSTKRKAPRLAGTERKENFDVQNVAPAGVPVNGQTHCDAAQRLEVRDAR